MSFSTDIKHWPYPEGSKQPKECIYFNNARGLTWTSDGTGTLEGNGKVWWGKPGIGYLIREERRPRLLNIQYSNDTLIENLYFHNSPYWTFYAHEVFGLEVRNSAISNKRDPKEDSHTYIDLTAFNTDGFDVNGHNIHIHDVDVWCQDDTIAVKGSSSNILIERVRASGIGLTIGSIGNDIVSNVTFRDAYMHNPYKGIYMKFRNSGHLIKDITYENIVIDSPSNTPIWIGPA